VSRAFNFSAGPAALPEPVLRRAQAEMLEWGGARASVMEVSHRGQDFVECAAAAEAALRRLLSVPGDYQVLFLQGGATQHFAQIPMNIASGRSSDYIVTGHWGEKAVAEARNVCPVRVVASSVDDAYRSIPDLAAADFDPAAAYVHYTPNETIHGVEFHHIPEVGDAPLVADASSTILSRPLDISRFGVIYAGAQKNIGPSGLVLLIVRSDLLDRAPDSLPSILRYSAQSQNDSMLNTPNTFAWYLAGLVFEWLEGEGGLTAIAERNQRKADLLYASIDGSGGFYSNPVAVAARSRMNVPFVLRDPKLDKAFLAESESAGLLALKGHRAIGGMRASLYNAMPLEGVAALTTFMADFARRNG